MICTVIVVVHSGRIWRLCCGRHRGGDDAREHDAATGAVMQAISSAGKAIEEQSLIPQRKMYALSMQDSEQLWRQERSRERKRVW